MKSKLLSLFQDMYKNEKRTLPLLCAIRKILEQLSLACDAHIQECGCEPSESRKALDVIMQAIEDSIGKTDELIYRVEHPEE
jgi:hypothetical protein